MTILASSASLYLARQASWQDDEARSKLSTASDDELRILLMMAIAEGQSQVEDWVLDEMFDRGIQSFSRRASLVRQSGMDPRDWLEKAMALVLAGGMMAGMWGATLPTVDQTISGGGDRPAATQVYEQAEIQLIQEAEALFRSAGLTFPDVDIVFNNSCDGHVNGTFGGENLVRVCNGELGTLVHELGHAWEAQFMTDSARQRFAEELGLDSWDTPGLDWADKPWERTAEVIKWKVMGGSHNGIYDGYFSIITS